MDQVKEQLTLAVEKLKERQENELLNKSYGLLNNVDPDMRIKTRKGPPTPDDLDELISTVWKEPAFFLAHPKAIAAFGRECTRRGVPPPTVSLFGSPFLTWRGLPLVPSDKLPDQGQEDRDPAHARRRAEARRRRPVPAGPPRRGEPEPVGSHDGHQPEGRRAVPDLALLLGRRCSRTTRSACSRASTVDHYHEYP